MAKRVPAVPVEKFTAFLMLVLLESDDREGILDDDELFDCAFVVFEGDEDVAERAVLRFESFFATMGRIRLEEFTPNRDGTMRFHPALMHAAAECRTRPNGSFPDRVFEDLVRELARTRYGDFEFK
jgi:hypothetical protein